MRRVSASVCSCATSTRVFAPSGSAARAASARFSSRIRLGQLGGEAARARVEIGALRLDPLELRGRAILGAAASRAAVSARSSEARAAAASARAAAIRRFGVVELAVGLVDRALRRRARLVERREPVDAFEPLRRRRAARLGDIAVPAPQRPAERHQPLPDRERLAVVASATSTCASRRASAAGAST